MQGATRLAVVRLVLACCGLLAGPFCGPEMSSDMAHAAEPSFTLTVRGGLLTVQLHRVPLGRVLSELARQARIRVQLPQSIQADLISDAFTDMSLEHGISRLLQGHSFAMFHGIPSAQSQASRQITLTEVWVLPKSQQAQLAPSVADAEEAWSRPGFLDEGDPAVRLAALDDLADRRDPIALDTLAQAMVDADETVRAKAQALFDRALLQPGAASAQGPERGGALNGHFQ